MKLRLVDDPPAAGAAAAFLEGASEFHAQGRRRQRMGRRGPRMGVQASFHDFGHHMRRRVEHIPIGRAARGVVQGRPAMGPCCGSPN